ncbi:hypothetical protein HMPREF3136_06645 [Neisseria sp. HMSC15C08]|uniref:hypothetical protein n=1 Tax=Neisseria mucosa TaxID=488 RepID=UPI0008A3CE6B|nr:hypothetical protein [Neisseria mucosa]OFV35188.1 hypothetical protein HMPREF3136_06645 [Neisseria sp. HMSC15C08]
MNSSFQTTSSPANLFLKPLTSAVIHQTEIHWKFEKADISKTVAEIQPKPLQKIPFPQQPKTHVWVSAVRERRILQRSAFASTEFKPFYIDFIFYISRFLPVSF